MVSRREFRLTLIFMVLVGALLAYLAVNPLLAQSSNPEPDNDVPRAEAISIIGLSSTITAGHEEDFELYAQFLDTGSTYRMEMAVLTGNDVVGLEDAEEGDEGITVYPMQPIEERDSPYACGLYYKGLDNVSGVTSKTWGLTLKTCSSSSSHSLARLRASLWLYLDEDPEEIEVDRYNYTVAVVAPPTPTPTPPTPTPPTPTPPTPTPSPPTPSPPPNPPTNLSLSRSEDEYTELRIDYTRSGPPHYYEFQLQSSTDGGSSFSDYGSAINSTSPPAFVDVVQGRRYRATGRNCENILRTRCGSWSSYSNIVYVPSGSVEIMGLDNTITPDEDHDFSVEATQLDTSEEYQMGMEVTDGREIVTLLTRQSSDTDIDTEDPKTYPPPIESRNGDECGVWLKSSRSFHDVTERTWDLTIRACTDGEATLQAHLFLPVPIGEDEIIVASDTQNVTVDPPSRTVRFGDDDYGVSEGSSVSIEVVLSESSNQSLTIEIEVTNGTAQNSDYTIAGLINDSLTFGNGIESRSFTVTALEDLDCGTETLTVGFRNLPAGVGRGVPREAIVTINDPCPMIEILNESSVDEEELVTEMERGEQDVFTIRASNLSPSVDYAIEVTTDEDDLGFTSVCNQSHAVDIPGRPKSYSTQVTLEGCGAPGGRVEAILTSNDGNTTHDTDSQSVIVRDPEIALGQDLLDQMEKNEERRFTVTASDLVTLPGYEYTIEVQASHSDIGFEEGCQNRSESHTVSGVSRRTLTLTLYGCDTDGGAVTATLTRVGMAARLHTRSVTVKEPQVEIVEGVTAVEKGHNDDFRISAFNLVTLNGYRYKIKAEADNGNVGFTSPRPGASACTDLQDEVQVPAETAAYEASVTVYGCAEGSAEVQITLTRGTKTLYAAPPQIVVVKVPQIQISGLAEEVEVDEEDKFTLHASNLVTSNNYTIRITTDVEGLGFSTNGPTDCSVSQEDFTVPVGSSTFTTTSPTVRACAYPGGIIEAQLLRDRTAVVSTASESITVPLPTPSKLTASPGDGEVHLKWKYVTGATSYAVQQWDGNLGVEEWRTLPFDDFDIRFSGSGAIVDGLANAVTHSYRVRSENNSAGDVSAWTDPHLEYFLPLASPTHLDITPLHLPQQNDLATEEEMAKATRELRVKLSWTPPDHNPAGTRYAVWIRPEGDPWPPTGATDTVSNPPITIPLDVQDFAQDLVYEIVVQTRHDDHPNDPPQSRSIFLADTLITFVNGYDPNAEGTQGNPVVTWVGPSDVEIAHYNIRWRQLGLDDKELSHSDLLPHDSNRLPSDGITNTTPIGWAIDAESLKTYDEGDSQTIHSRLQTSFDFASYSNHSLELDAIYAIQLNYVNHETEVPVFAAREAYVFPSTERPEDERIASIPVFRRFPESYVYQICVDTFPEDTAPDWMRVVKHALDQWNIVPGVQVTAYGGTECQDFSLYVAELVLEIENHDLLNQVPEADWPARVRRMLNQLENLNLQTIGFSKNEVQMFTSQAEFASLRKIVEKFPELSKEIGFPHCYFGTSYGCATRHYKEENGAVVHTVDISLNSRQLNNRGVGDDPPDAETNRFPFSACPASDDPFAYLAYSTLVHETGHVLGMASGESWDDTVNLKFDNAGARNILRAHPSTALHGSESIMRNRSNKSAPFYCAPLPLDKLVIASLYAE